MCGKCQNLEKKNFELRCLAKALCCKSLLINQIMEQQGREAEASQTDRGEERTFGWWTNSTFQGKKLSLQKTRVYLPSSFPPRLLNSYLERRRLHFTPVKAELLREHPMGQPTKIGPNMSKEQLNIFRWSEKVRLLICMIGNELVYADKKKIFWGIGIFLSMRKQWMS